MTSLVQTRPGMMSWKVKAGLSTNWIFLNILLLEHLEPQTGDVLKHNCENGDVLKENCGSPVGLRRPHGYHIDTDKCSWPGAPK